ncbi:MAG: hypothetical protein JO360_06810 [Acidobacteria bacterium]|nr:hypothetical protein [Acidobacteriota bacterium]
MLLKINCSWLRSVLFILLLLCAVQAQQSFPAPPADRAQIYLVNDAGALEALPFEAGTTPLKALAVAGSDKRSYVELKGTAAAKSIREALPRFYLFVPDAAGAHPPFLVRLSERRGARRVTAMAQKGLRGFAIDSEEIVKPHYRVLQRADGLLYMEISPRESLTPGEYAIIGADLQRIATFRVVSAASP